MAITKTTTYAGTVEIVSRKQLRFDPEMIEHVEGNQRWQEPTGGWIVTATYDVGGTDETVSATVPVAQLATKTVGQIVTAADALLKTKLGIA